MYEVFFNDRVVFVGSSFKKSLTDDNIVVDVKSKDDIFFGWNKFTKSIDSRNLFLLTDDIEASFSMFKEIFKTVYAAGGVVKNRSGKLLCIYRLGKWDLPKGKLEKGEKIEEAALREVTEECGIDRIELRGLNCITHHIYLNPRNPEEWILKPTYWFNMDYLDNIEVLIPQLEEGIVEARWVDKKDLSRVIENTWHSLISIFLNFSNLE